MVLRRKELWIRSIQRSIADRFCCHGMQSCLHSVF
jgi:hypothetical protein